MRDVLPQAAAAVAVRVRCGVVPGITPGRCDDNNYTGPVKNCIASPTSAYVFCPLALNVAAPDVPTILMTCGSFTWSFPAVGGAASVLQDGMIAPYASLRSIGPTGFWFIVNWPNGVPGPHMGPGHPNSAPAVVDVHYLVVD